MECSTPTIYASLCFKYVINYSKEQFHANKNKINKIKANYN